MNGDAGFGISSTIALEVSQSFFVEMTLPFSVVQNEQSDVIVSVFSYLNTCAEVSCSLCSRDKNLTRAKESLLFSLNIAIFFILKCKMVQ